jgi:AAA family ATP:ADP antiporter
VLAAYYVIRPVREQLSAAVGSTQLPWFYGATFIGTLLLSPLFAALITRWPRRVVVPVVYVFFIACLIGFVPLFTGQGLLTPKALGMLFFVWVSVFNLFVVSVFWSFMSDIWSSEQARRLFPIIAVAGTVGAVTGPALTRSLVGVIGVAPLLVVSAGLLCIALGCVVALGHWAPAWRASARTGARSRRGWRHVRRFEADFRRPVHPQHVAAAVAGRRHRHGQLRIGDGLFQPQLRRRCHRAHAFAANVDLAANVLTVIAQLTLTRWLLPKKGPAPVILIWALVSIAVLLVVVFSPDPHAPLLLGMPAVAVALIVSRGLAYGMAEPARHSLYTRVPRNVRYKARTRWTLRCGVSAISPSR